MKKITLKKIQVQSQLSIKGILCLCAVLLMSSQVSWGQVTPQMIGSFPWMDGGENISGLGGIGISSNPSSTAWRYYYATTGMSANTVTTDAAVARSGARYINLTSSGVEGAWSTNSGTTGYYILTTPRQGTGTYSTMAVSTSYVVQFYYKTSATGVKFNGMIMPQGTKNTLPGYGYAAAGLTQVPVVEGVESSSATTEWTKYTTVITTDATPTMVTNQCAAIKIGNSASGTTIFIDDFAVYAGSAVDETVPDAPTAPAVSGLNVSWTAPTTGVDGGGYVVVRYATTPNANNMPTTNAVYAVGNTITNGTGALPGTVVYVGAGTSFTDAVAGSVSGSDIYRVYTVDKAFNYSVGAGPTLGVNDFSVNNSVNVFSNPGKISLSNVISNTQVEVYSMVGALVKSVKTTSDTSIDVNAGVYVVKVKSAEGTKSVKVIVK